MVKKSSRKYIDDNQNKSTTDFSFADRYLEDRRTGKYWRIQIGFPWSDDRRAANIDYSDPYWHRSFRGKAPVYGPDWSDLDGGEEDLSTAEYQFVSNARNGSNVPVGYYGTSSGISVVDFVPFTVGSPTDNPAVISGDVGNSVSGEFLIAKNVETSNIDGDQHPYYYTVSGNPGRFNWEILPEFQNPTEPEVRFPNGARRKKFFRY